MAGYTDEVGVQLPPLHPRCRCAIIYRETGNPNLTAPRSTGNVRPSRGLAAGNIDVATTTGSPPKLIERIEFAPAIIQKTLEHYEAQIVNAEVEHAVIITKAGEVYHCNGDVHGIALEYFERLGAKLNGAHVTHNHPPDAYENDHTFSNEDMTRFVHYKMARLRGIDAKYLYELNRNPADNELAVYDFVEIYSLGLDFTDCHTLFMLKALGQGFGYWRRER